MSGGFYLGVDVGSLSCDAVLITDEERIVAWSVVPTGARNCEAIARARDEVLRAAGILPTSGSRSPCCWETSPPSRLLGPTATSSPARAS
jgi:hypothetical protein